MSHNRKNMLGIGPDAEKDLVASRNILSFLGSRGAFTVYHGSNTVVKSPEIDRGRPDTDFGQGFYVTNDYRTAKSHADTITSLRKSGKPIVNRYTFDYRSASRRIPALIRIYYAPNREWAVTIKNHRAYRAEPECPIIIGPIADVGITDATSKFLAGNISENEYLTKLEAFVIGGRDVFQIAFCTEEALSYLIYQR